MGNRFPQPDNEDAFELMCLRMYRKVWKNESLQLYAKRGEKQHGVDIHDPLSLAPARAVQCKFHEPTKTISPAEIQEEVSKAETAPFSIDHYVIATTARKSGNAQDAVVALNGRANKKFTVEIQFWEEICEQLDRLLVPQAVFIVYGKDAASDLLASLLQDSQMRAACSLLISSETGSAEGAYGEIEQLLIDRKLEAAEHALAKLPIDGKLEELSAEERYKISRLRGKLALERGRFEEAADLFITAFSLQPDLEQAKQNRVLAYSLLLDYPKVFELACQYIGEGLATPTMLCRLIESSTSVNQINAHDSILAPLRETNEDVNIALSHKLAQLGDDASAAEAAFRAIKISPRSPHAQFAAAMGCHRVALSGDWRERTRRLNDALSHYDSAIDDAKRSHYVNLLPEAFLNRAGVCALLGDDAGASASYRSAVEVASRPPAYAAHAVSFALHAERYEDGWQLVPYLDRSSTEGRFLIAMIEFNTTNVKDEHYRIIEDLRSMADEQWPRAIECRLHCVNFAIRLKDLALAADCITDDFKLSAPIQASIALAWICLESRDLVKAIEHANAAVTRDLGGLHRQELSLLANLLIKLDQHSQALDVLERMVVPGLLNDDMKLLVRTAEKLGRHDLLLRICRELRGTRQQDAVIQRLELQLLSRYSPDEAFELAGKLVESNSESKYFVAFRNALAVRLDRLDEIELSHQRLPAPSELPPEESALVVMPYLKKLRFDDALRYLHAQLRHFFENERAHGGYVSFFLSFSNRTAMREPPTRVTNDSAVLLEMGNGRQRWIVIELSNPVPSRGEIAPSSVLGQRLIDCKVGETVRLPAAMVEEETATIVAIESKYVRAFQDCIEHFRERFPDTSFIQQINVGHGDEFDPTIIIESLKKRKEHVLKCIELYDSHPCPLYLFAKHVGINELEAIRALASYPKGQIKCCQVTPEEFARTVDDRVTSELIVVDITAAITLTLTNSWHALDLASNYYVTQSTRELVAQWVEEFDATTEGSTGHTSLSDDGKLLLRETSIKEKTAELEELKLILRMLNERCLCRSSESLQALDPEKRRNYEEIAGFHNLDAMCLAKDLNATLWTDDHVLGFIAKTDFQVNRQWTQLALGRLVSIGRFSGSEYDLVSAKLVAWNYTQTVWNSAIIMRGGEYAQFDVQDWPFKQCVALLANESFPIQIRARNALACLKILMQSSCSKVMEPSVVLAILEALGHRSAVVWMLNQLEKVFRYDPASQENLRLQLTFWLKER